jgi:hypothetical protein
MQKTVQMLTHQHAINVQQAFANHASPEFQIRVARLPGCPGARYQRARLANEPRPHWVGG